MKDQFVPYELAVKLKESGFNEPALACYTQNAYGSESKKIQYFVEFLENVNEDHVFISAPLWQQAFDWFRNTHEIDSSIDKCYDSYNISITKWDSYEDGNIDITDGLTFKDFKDYNKAREACLLKLIELI